MRTLTGTFAQRFAGAPPVILDGALGTELERRGVETGLPLWSTHALLEAPETVESILREYAQAGAEVLTAGTFRTQARTLARSDVPGLADLAEEITARAVDLARRAASAVDAPVWIAGSAPPLEDCYRPDLVPIYFPAFLRSSAEIGKTLNNEVGSKSLPFHRPRPTGWARFCIPI